MVDGPYGNIPLAIDGDRYKLFIFIAGGIGINIILKY
jgi:predicted ferric reductase